MNKYSFLDMVIAVQSNKDSTAPPIAPTIARGGKNNPPIVPTTPCHLCQSFHSSLQSICLSICVPLIIFIPFVVIVIVVAVVISFLPNSEVS